jgi:tetratricopeptide (TPR) repeat protein
VVPAAVAQDGSARAAGRPADEEAAGWHRLAALARAGRHAEAEREAQALLMKRPEFGPFWSVLALSQWMQGKDALAALERAAQLMPEDAEAQGNLGTALRARGRLTEAVDRYRRALEIAPQFAEAHNNLGGALRDLGELEEAAACYRRALAIKPDFAVAHCNLGHVLRTMGRFDEAAGHYRSAIDLDDALAEAHSGLGNTLQELGRSEPALMSHRQALRLMPDAAESHRNLGNALLDLLRFEEAESSYRQAIALDPGLAEAHCKLGAVLRLRGRPVEAEASCRRALELNPALVDALVLSATLLADKGEFAAAESAFNRVISTEPESVDAWAGIAGLRKMTVDDAAWAAGAQRIAALPMPARRQANVRFAIGKYFDDVRDFPRAFDNYHRANESSKLYSAPYDGPLVERGFGRIMEFYDRAWLDAARFTGSGSPRPLFVVGMPRSGTTLTEQILAAHPAVFGAGEVSFWVGASKGYLMTPPGEGGAAGVIEQLAGAYLRLLDERSHDALRVVDKMPGNFEALGLIHAALPNARIIHIRRNPIDTCLSIYFQNFNASHAYANDLANLAHYYGQYGRLMQHWRRTLPEHSLLEISYEDLIEDQERWSRQMVEFAGLDWDPRCLNFDAVRPSAGDRTILTFSKWQARQKISKSSMARWRNYEPFIGPLLGLAPRQ